MAWRIKTTLAHRHGRAVNEALGTVPGVTGNTAAKGAKTFEVTGDFNDKEVFDALQKAGFTGQEK